MIYIIVLLILFAGMLLYIKLANKYLIFDRPNDRSSHTTPTVRGGGIIFVLSILIAGVYHYSDYGLPILGALLIGTISFLDDNMNISRLLRFFFHMLAVTFLFMYDQVFDLPIWAIIALYILVVGIINAYNFMDGINGITGLYSLAVLGSLQYVNIVKFPFIEADLIWFPMLACIAFLYFNFRKKALVFAGDIGSISMAFWIVFLLLDLILKSNNWLYILFLTVYGVDSILTIIHRLILKQNIFEAHRFHFYQILVNDQKISHRLVAFFYAVLQVGISAFVIQSNLSPLLTFLLSPLFLVIIYIVLKPKLMQQSM